MLRQPLEQRLEVLDAQRDVAVAVAELIRLVAALVDRQLERVPVAREPQVDVVGAFELQPASALEAQRRVEAQRGVDVADADIGVHESHRSLLTEDVDQIDDRVDDPRRTIGVAVGVGRPLMPKRRTRVQHAHVP